MSEFTTRERGILFYLLAQDEPVQLAKIADAVETSERTIHREREQIERLLAPFGLKLLLVRGKGWFLEGEEDERRMLREQLLLSHGTSPTTEDRQVELAWRLLDESGLIKLQALAHQMHISPSTLSQDLDKVDGWFSEHNLRIDRRKGIGAEVIGTEFNRRRMMISLLFAQWDVLAFFRFLQGDLNQLPALLQSRRQRWIEALNSSYALIATLPLDQQRSDRLIMRGTLALAVQSIRMFEHKEMQYELKTYPLDVLKWVDLIQSKREDILPITERQWISEEIKRMIQSEEQGSNEEGEGIVVRLRVKKLIEQVSLLYGRSFLHDNALENGLVSHLLSYTKQNAPNPAVVIKQIEREYPRLFDSVKQAAHAVFGIHSYSDYDLAFWVMHFGAVLVQPNVKVPYRVLVVCSAGLGSSKMLLNRLRHEFPELSELQNSSLFGIGQLNLDQFDFILATVPLPEVPIPHLIVNPLLPQEEVQRVRKMILSLPKSFQAEKKPVKKEILDLKRLKEIVDQAHSIDEGLSVSKLAMNPGAGVEEVLLAVSNHFEAEEFVDSAVQLSSRLLRRHEMTGLGIPGTTIALFHGRDDTVKRSSFRVFDLPGPLSLSSMDQSEQSVERLLVLIAPEEAPDAALMLLSAISGAIIESPVQTSIFENGDLDEIRRVVNESFRLLIEREIGAQ
ncbi:BglG family transcription antiterminator [Exiguobacterium flavidum]|uniref:BglG family transcription antiterminator n=1 Tax=Exiguobacterium flavidum TaxID=2184695 RepID=UPI000DF828C6|nr:PTS sugar transporter subunit IIA [Exiguobacterium flavidum]